LKSNVRESYSLTKKQKKKKEAQQATQHQRVLHEKSAVLGEAQFERLLGGRRDIWPALNG